MCLLSRPDRAVTLIHVVPCLPPPCCLTLKNLLVMSAIWSLILSSSPHLVVEIQLHPAPSADLSALLRKRIGYFQSQELSQLRAKKNSLGPPESAILSLGNFPLQNQQVEVSVADSFLTSHLTLFIQSLHMGHIVGIWLKTLSPKYSTLLTFQ